MSDFLFVNVSRFVTLDGAMDFSGNSSLFCVPKEAYGDVQKKAAKFVDGHPHFKDLRSVPYGNGVRIFVPEWNAPVADFSTAVVDWEEVNLEPVERGFTRDECEGIYVVASFDSVTLRVSAEVFGTLDKAKAYIDQQVDGTDVHEYWDGDAFCVKSADMSSPAVSRIFRVDNLPVWGKHSIRKQLPQWVQDVLPRYRVPRGKKAIPTRDILSLPLGNGGDDAQVKFCPFALDGSCPRIDGSGKECPCGNSVDGEAIFCPISAERTWCYPMSENLLLTRIAKGEGVIGVPQDEDSCGGYFPEKAVQIPEDFWIGVFPVTVGNWKVVMKEYELSPNVYPHIRQRNNNWDFNCLERYSSLPVSIHYSEAEKFCEKLNEQYAEFLPQGYRFRLPTEVEWEYACRCNAMPRTKFSFGDDFDASRANCRESEIDHLTPVNKYPPNAWGIYDMHGNQMELCTVDKTTFPDRQDRYYSCKEWTGRGGKYNEFARECTSSSRIQAFQMSDYATLIGFRVVLAKEVK